MIPYPNESRQEYIDRNKEKHLTLAESFCNGGYDFASWTQLFTWVQADEIYGDHWDFVENNRKEKHLNGYHTTCKYCGRGLLTWKQVNGKWRMLDTKDAVHVCEQMRIEKIKESKLRKQYT